MEFSDCVGEFYFHEGNIRLNLWDEFSECVDNKNEDRLWLVESDDCLLFNENILERKDITLETIDKFCNWLNTHLVEKKWKDISLSVWGKIIFYDNLNHDNICVVLWKGEKFHVKLHDFSL